jgi:hypothetical protein
MLLGMRGTVRGRISGAEHARVDDGDRDAGRELAQQQQRHKQVGTSTEHAPHYTGSRRTRNLGRGAAPVSRRV